MLDEQAFDDFMTANADDFGEDLIAQSVDFKRKIVIARRLYTALFGTEAQADPREPGIFQGTLLLVKLQQELGDER